jgi:multidrug transporter EmrE-like cation transporter
MLQREKIIIYICVLIMVLGQVIFKQVALNYNRAGSLLSWSVLGLGSVGIVLYGLSTLLWIVVLQTVPISKAYPFFALGFVLIPLAGVLFFGESIFISQYVGITLIIAGIACIGVAP